MTLDVGQDVYLKKDGELLHCKIESLQVNGEDVNNAIGSGAEIGIGLSHATTKSIEILILNPSTAG